MLILTKTADIASLPPGELYRHIHRSVDQLLNQFEPGDFTLEELGRYIVVQPGDTISDINQQLGFNILGNRWNGTRWGDPAFTPSWEIMESHPNYFELVFMQGDSGYGVTVLVGKAEGVDPELLAMCRRYSTPGDTV